MAGWWASLPARPSELWAAGRGVDSKSEQSRKFTQNQRCPLEAEGLRALCKVVVWRIGTPRHNKELNRSLVQALLTIEHRVGCVETDDSTFRFEAFA